MKERHLQIKCREHSFSHLASEGVTSGLTTVCTHMQRKQCSLFPMQASCAVHTCRTPSAAAWRNSTQTLYGSLVICTELRRWLSSKFERPRLGQKDKVSHGAIQSFNPSSHEHVQGGLSTALYLPDNNSLPEEKFQLAASEPRDKWQASAAQTI